MTESLPVLTPPMLDDFVETLTPAELAEHEARHVREGDIARMRRWTMQAFTESRTSLRERFQTPQDVDVLGRWVDAAKDYRDECWSEAGFANACYQRLPSALLAAEKHLRKQ